MVDGLAAYIKGREKSRRRLLLESFCFGHLPELWVKHFPVWYSLVPGWPGSRVSDIYRLQVLACCDEGLYCSGVNWGILSGDAFKPLIHLAGFQPCFSER
jgi:hypothetical protein